MKKLYFMWDYDLSEQQIHNILNGNNQVEKLWLTARIMTHAKFENIWQYLHVKDIVEVFSKLRLSPKDKQNWQRTLSIWGYHV